HHFLPPTTAPIHYSVVQCASEEVQAFTQKLDYFRILLDARTAPGEEVLAAHIRFAAASRNVSGPMAESPYEFSVRAGREVATLLRTDHQRLAAIVTRIRPPIDQRALG